MPLWSVWKCALIFEPASGFFRRLQKRDSEQPLNENGRHITLIGCPKLDDGNYAEKLTEIIRSNIIKSVTVVRMEVPCCGGIENAVKQALLASGKFIPWRVVTISTDGRILE